MSQTFDRGKNDTAKNAFFFKGSSAQCDTNTGQCNCKNHVTGADCSQCKPGYFGLSASLPTGCIACNCDNKGTVGNTGGCFRCLQFYCDAYTQLYFDWANLTHIFNG